MWLGLTIGLLENFKQHLLGPDDNLAAKRTLEAYLCGAISGTWYIMGSTVYTDVHGFWKHLPREPTLETDTVLIHPLSAQPSTRVVVTVEARAVKAFLLSRIPLPPQGSLSRPTVGTQ